MFTVNLHGFESIAMMVTLSIIIYTLLLPTHDHNAVEKQVFDMVSVIINNHIDKEQ